MTNPKEQDLKKLLLDFKSEYKKAFPQKLSTIKQLAAEKNWQQLVEELHKIKGSGKTYGYPEVSILAEALEALCSKQNFDDIDKAWPIFSRMQQAWDKNLHYDLLSDEEAQTLIQGAKK